MQIFSPNLSSLSKDWTKAKAQLASAMDELVGSISSGWNAQHDSEGHHTDVTADSLSLAGNPAGQFVELELLQNRFGHPQTSNFGDAAWTVNKTANSYLRYIRVGQLVTVLFNLQSTSVVDVAAAGPTGRPYGLLIHIPELSPSILPNTSSASVGATYYRGGLAKWEERATSTSIFPDRAGLGLVTAATIDTSDPEKPGTQIVIEKYSSSDLVTDTFDATVHQMRFDYTSGGGSTTVAGQISFLCEN